MKKRTFQRALLALTGATMLAGAALAQTAAPAAGPMVELSQYSGADRLERLIAGAKKEGKLSIYTSAPTDDIGALIAAFEKKYGIKVSVWRSGSENVLQRTVTEARGNRFTVDVVETNGPELESIAREKLFQPIASPHHANLMTEAVMPHKAWVSTRLNVFVQAYNTKLVKKEELPKTWQDLALPHWKGRLGVEAEDQDWLAGVAGLLGEERGIKTFREVVANNGVSVRKGHTLLTQMVVSGEVPFALTVYNYKAEQLKQKGAPIDWIAIGSAVPRPNGVGVLRSAPNPHAAMLFYEFEISEEGQKLLSDRGSMPTNPKVDTPFSKLPIKIVDVRVMLDEYDKWNKLFDDIFAIKR
mgnify:CR=1 FL=1